MAANDAIIYTVKAKCRDCYRCLRHCPVNAIGIRDGQAYVDQARCILCGTCVRECPQGAKAFRNDIGMVREFINNGRVVATLAPSFAAVFESWQIKRLPAALRMLGFSRVYETAEAAPLSAQHARRLMEESGRRGIYTACPVVVNYVEKYRPDHLPWLVDAASPMVIDGHMIKSKLGRDCRVVFIGPCIAKKGEAAREVHSGAIDAVLTFDELYDWLREEGVSLKECAESGFDSVGGQPFSRLFPLPGAMSVTAGMKSDGAGFLSTSGAENVMALFDGDWKDEKFGAEPLFCAEGCINGPCAACDKNLFQRRQDLYGYAGQLKEETAAAEPGIDCNTVYLAACIEISAPTQAQIDEVYKNTGKLDSDQQLNCGACGYKTCRDMAVAVLSGMAEEEMCIPYMRRCAEARSDRIMESMPSGVLIADGELNIAGMNPAFRKFFMCNDAVIGRSVSYLMDAAGFEQLSSGVREVVDGLVVCYGRQYHQILFSLPDENRFVGIFADITELKLNEQKLESIKRRTAEQARELLENQLEMARQVAAFLGKSTARSEEILERLMGYDEEKR